MFNPNVKQAEDASRQTLGYGSLSKIWTGSNSSVSATLIIFSPRALSKQFVRPYVFNFNDNFIDEVVGRQFDSNIFNGMNRKSDAVLNAIMPTSFEGIYQVRNEELSFYYTFMLIIQKDQAHDALSPFLRAPSPMKRQLISGYFLQEPYNPNTMYMGAPTINPNAMMVFTHDSVFHISPHDMTRRGNTLINMNHNADNISRVTEQMVVPGVGNNGDNKLYMMRPMDLDRAAGLSASFGNLNDPSNDPSFVSGMANASLDAVAGARGGNAAVPLACSLKSPMAQLNHICDAARTVMYANLYDNGNTNSFTNPFIPRQDDPVNAHRYMAQNFSSSLETVDLNPMTREGSDVDTSIPMSIAQLDQMFGNKLLIMPFIVESRASCELTPQDEITSHKSVMSSMLASTISSMLPCYNIGGIAFSYYSYRSDTGGLGRKGIWVLSSVDPLIPNIGPDGIDHHLQACIQMFYREMENNLFPILLNAGGDFELHVEINCFNVSLVNLIFMDEKGMCQNPNGYWETNNCFNSFTNPLLAGENIAARNVNSLAAFKDATLASLTDTTTNISF